MTDDELRQACEALLLKWFDLGARGSWGGAMLDEFVSFSKQQQAVGMRRAANEARQFSKPYDIAWWRTVTKKDVSVQMCLDIADFCEAKAKELEA